MPHLEFTGASVITGLKDGISAVALTCKLNDGSNWPTGAGGKNFVMTLGDADAGQAQEKCLCSSRSGNDIVIVSRGYDGTAPQSWGPNTRARHTISGIWAAEVSDHIFDDARDDHSQYHTAARHAAVSHTQAMMGAASVGTAQIVDDSVTQPKIGPGAVGTTELATGGVVAGPIPNLGIITALLNDLAVTTAKLADLGVTTPKIADDAVTAPKVADGAIDDLLKIVANLFTTAHSQFTPTFPQSSTNTTYAGFPATEEYSLAHTKKIAGSRILVWFSGALFCDSGAPGGVSFAVRADSGADNFLTQYHFTENDVHHAVSGWAVITGLGAGAHTYALRFLSQDGGGRSFVADDNDTLQFLIVELP